MSARHSHRWIALVATFALAATACGPTYAAAFGYQFRDNDETDLAAVLERLPAPSRDDQPRNVTGEPIVVVGTHAEDDADRHIAAYRVDSGEAMWDVPIASATQPEILGDLVLASTRESLIALDLQTGRELWRYPLPDLAYVGAARDGDQLYWAATVGALGGARRVGHVVAVDARSGAEVWRHEVVGVFGQPAAMGGLVFVPWERQNIAVLDHETGDEVARLRSTDDVIAWAFDHPTGIYYGGRGIYRLTHNSVSGERATSTHVRPPLGDLPRQPESIWPDGYVPRPGARSARGRIRVYFNPAPAEDDTEIHVEGDTYYFTYYRYVFAFDLEGTLRWTRILEQDVVNAEATPNGILTVGEQGALRLLDRSTGRDRYSQDLGVQVASVSLDAAGFQAPPAEDEAPVPLRTSLNELVLDPDNRLVAARSYAVSQLAAIEEPEVTRDLLDLYQQRSMPGALKEAIREALRGRETGEQYLMEALARRYDYLEETEAPPLEAIVPALLEMEHREAVPRLVQHLFDHETPAEVLPELVSAIVELGHEEAVEPLRRFLVLYQADSDFVGPVATVPPSEDGGDPTPADPEARALALASAGVFQYGGPEGRELLASLRERTARMHDAVSAHIAGLYEAEAEAARQAEAAEAAAAEEALADAARQAEAALPRQLSQDQVNQTFADNADPVRECIAGELERNPRLAQVRLLFILSNEGRASDLTVAPNSDELSQCLRERVTQLQFPRFRQRLMRASFVVSIRGTNEDVEDAAPAIAAVPDDAPWWTWSERRAELHGTPDPVWAATPAWWTERDAPVQATVNVNIPEEHELPPGMTESVARAARERRAEQTDRPNPGRTQPEETPASGGGQPWWAGAASEEEEEEEAPEPPAPAPAPRR